MSSHDMSPIFEAKLFATEYLHAGLFCCLLSVAGLGICALVETVVEVCR